jgi:hypothetical protein
MSASDSGTWKLIIYPLVIILVIGLVLNITLQPFLDSGIYPNNANQTEMTQFNTFLTSGLEVTIDIPLLGEWTPVIPSPVQLVPTFMRDFLSEQITILAYLPTVILIPLMIIFSVAFAYVLWVLIGMWIP